MKFHFSFFFLFYSCLLYSQSTEQGWLYSIGVNHHQDFDFTYRVFDLNTSLPSDVFQKVYWLPSVGVTKRWAEGKHIHSVGIEEISYNQFGRNSPTTILGRPSINQEVYQGRISIRYTNTFLLKKTTQFHVGIGGFTALRGSHQLIIPNTSASFLTTTTRATFTFGVQPEFFINKKIGLLLYAPIELINFNTISTTTQNPTLLPRERQRFSFLGRLLPRNWGIYLGFQRFL
jgi:hypothetical protein